MKKIITLLITLTLSFSLLLSSIPVGTASADEPDYNGRTLRICNCEDYIDEELLTEFEDEFNCKIEYSTFGTLENLYNDIIITPGRYDLICPSDYMIEKMAREGMLQKITLDKNGTYNTYASQFIKDTFDGISWNDGKDKLSDYATCYMWGTLGLTYNPEYVSHEDIKSWSSLWMREYKNQSTIKDSIRDSYFMGIAYAKKDVLDSLSSDYALGKITLDNYQSELSKIFNDTTPETINAVGNVLKNLKSNIYGFEVDSGKNDVASGKININFAWSGDAVYAMDEAEKVGVELYYSVPEEGSNVWFDGWCVPKESKNVDLAIEFIEYMSRPDVVVRNMNYIGYTSGVAGEEVFNDVCVDWYGACTLVETDAITYEEYKKLVDEESDEASYYEADKNNKMYEYVYVLDMEDGFVWGDDENGYFANVSYIDEDKNLVTEKTELYKVDLGYFFGEGDWSVFTDTIGRQFSAQYPTEDIIARCVVMNCYDEDANERVVLMWESVKGFTFSDLALILLSVGVVLLILGVVLFKYRKSIFGKKDISKKENSRRKKYKVLNIKEI